MHIDWTLILYYVSLVDIFFLYVFFFVLFIHFILQQANIKPFIDTNYTVSDNPMQRHRALAIIKPMKNMTGEYTCEVGSYVNDDKRSKYLQMIVPETDLKLSVVEEYDNERGDEALSITCIAKNVYPEPKLTILYVSFNMCLSSSIYLEYTYR